MAGQTPLGEGLQPLVDQFAEIIRRLETLERPTGTQTGSLVAQVQAALANIDAKVQESIAANSYTRAQTDQRIADKVASPGDIAPTKVTSSGEVSGSNVRATGSVTGADASFNGAAGVNIPNGTVVSTYARNNQVTSSYVAAYINVDGKILASASGEQFKREIATYDGGDWRAIRAVVYKLRAAWVLNDMAGGDPDDVPREIGVIAQELLAAGYPELVVTDKKGRPWTVRYERIAAVAIAAAQEVDRRVDAIEGRLKEMGV